MNLQHNARGRLSKRSSASVLPSRRRRDVRKSCNVDKKQNVSVRFKGKKSKLPALLKQREVRLAKPWIKRGWKWKRQR
jgi:hypothetical protein